MQKLKPIHLRFPDDLKIACNGVLGLKNEKVFNYAKSSGIKGPLNYAYIKVIWCVQYIAYKKLIRYISHAFHLLLAIQCGDKNQYRINI